MHSARAMPGFGTHRTIGAPKTRTDIHIGKCIERITSFCSVPSCSVSQMLEFMPNSGKRSAHYCELHYLNTFLFVHALSNPNLVSSLLMVIFMYDDGTNKEHVHPNQSGHKVTGHSIRHVATYPSNEHFTAHYYGLVSS